MDIGQKRAFLVLGPESCGNRLLTRLLVAAGCLGDGRTGTQRLDSGKPQAEGASPIVWLRSIPHGRVWPKITDMVRQLHEKDYEVTALVPTRDWAAVIPSQVRAGHCRDEEEAWSNLQRAYPFIFGHIADAQVPFIVVSYESLVQRPTIVVEKLMKRLGLAIPELPEDIVDGNIKYLD